MSSQSFGNHWLYEWGGNKTAYDSPLRRTSTTDNTVVTEVAKEEAIPRLLRSANSENIHCDVSRGRMWSLADFDIGRKLGEGRFGKIYLAREKQTKCAVVLKCLSKDMIRYYNLTHQLRREVELQEYAGRCNGHILRLFAYFWDDVRIFLVLEYADGGTLQTLLDSKPRRRISEEDVRRILQPLLSALIFLHERDIIHRDLKPENILIKAQQVKLADFSWAVRLNCRDARHSRRYTLCGTMDYLAPEQVSKRGCTTKADMWALGVLTYLMLCGSLPFEHLSPWEVCARIAKGDVHYPSHLSREARCFLEALLCVDELKRLSSHEAMQHFFIQNQGNGCTSHASSTEMDLPSAVSFDCLTNPDHWETQLAYVPVSSHSKPLLARASANICEQERHQQTHQAERAHKDSGRGNMDDNGNNNSAICKWPTTGVLSSTHSCTSFVTVSLSHSADCVSSPHDLSTPSLSSIVRGERVPSVVAVVTGATRKSSSVDVATSSQGASYSRPRLHRGVSEGSDLTTTTTTHCYTQLEHSFPTPPLIISQNVDNNSVNASTEEKEEKDCALRLRFEDSYVSISQLTAVSESTVDTDESV